jgi:hypothetical protein
MIQAQTWRGEDGTGMIHPGIVPVAFSTSGDNPKG